MKSKATPNLPSSSRLTAPSSGGTKMAAKIKETGGMKGGSKKVTKKIMAAAKGKAVKAKAKY
jgi:hypothetical protein